MVSIARVAAVDTVALRRRVLRPHQSPDELAAPGDDEPDTGHFAATADGRVIATASARREEPPWASAGRPSWRLRGMATAEEWRGQGVGTSILAVVVDHVGRHGGGLVWCHARVPAVSFYRRAGFTTRGEVWHDPVIGPHTAMERMVEPRQDPTAGCGGIPRLRTEE